MGQSKIAMVNRITVYYITFILLAFGCNPEEKKESKGSHVKNNLGFENELSTNNPFKDSTCFFAVHRNRTESPKNTLVTKLDTTYFLAHEVLDTLLVDFRTTIDYPEPITILFIKIARDKKYHIDFLYKGKVKELNSVLFLKRENNNLLISLKYEGCHNENKYDQDTFDIYLNLKLSLSTKYEEYYEYSNYLSQQKQINFLKTNKRLDTLRRIELWAPDLEHIPSEILLCTQLESLYLFQFNLRNENFNFIKRLPNLINLNLRDCAMDSIPINLLTHKNLKHLTISSNIVTVPNELYSNNVLEIVNLSYNPLDTLSIIKRDKRKIIVW